MGPEELKADYWKMTAAATEVLQWWDLQQEDADGDWSAVIAAMERLREAIFGEAEGDGTGLEA